MEDPNTDTSNYTKMYEYLMLQLESIWSSYIIDGMDGLIYVGNNISYDLT